MIGNKPPHLWRWTSRKYFNSIINDRITAWKSQEEPSNRRILQMMLVAFSFAVPAIYSFGIFGAQENTYNKITPGPAKSPLKKICKKPAQSGTGTGSGAASGTESKPCKYQKGQSVEPILPPCPGE